MINQNEEITNLGKELLKNDFKIPTGKDDVSEILEQLKDGVSSLMSSDKYKKYLDYVSSFHHYSFRNVLLIAFQNPEATKVGSFTFWKTHNRYVKKGEHGIKILAPNISKVKKEVKVLDSEGRPVLNKDGSVKTENKIVSSITGFRIATVFDVSQTDGKEIPNILTKLSKNTPVSDLLINSVSAISKLPIEYQNIQGSANGYTDGEKIVVQENMSKDQTAKTLIHEYAHSEYHKDITDYQKNRSNYEIQAESTAYIVSKHFGLDTSDYTFGYVTSWAKGKSLDEYEDTLKKINDMANEIINKIETHLENEYDKLQTKEIINQVKAAKFNPTPEVIKKIEQLNHITNSTNSLAQIKQLARHTELTNEVKELAKDISNIFKNQELQKAAYSVIEPC